MRRAKEIGVEHISITDHKTLSGHLDFQQAGQEHGISVGLGLEGYFSTTDRFDRRAAKDRDDGTRVYNHIGIIAKNENGLKNLHALNQKAWTQGFYKVPRMDWELLEEYHDDLIVLSGCLSGVVSRAIDDGNLDNAIEWATKFKNLFGDDFYMEVMSHNDEALTKQHFAIADELGIKPIITSDCHHASPDDMVLQEAMLILSTGPSLTKSFDFKKAQKMDWLDRFNYMYPDRQMTFEKFDLHLNAGVEQFEKMKAIGYDRTDFIESTIEVAEKIGDYPIYKGLDLLPRPKGGDPDNLLRTYVEEGARQHGTYGDPVYDARRERELKVIKDKGFAPYFLVKRTIDTYADQEGIMRGPGRGSSAGSLVCYDLNITKVDPIKWGLLFERFLDLERNDWPDIDSDYEDTRRADIKAFCKRVFKNTGNIQTYTYMNGKNVVKDACKVLKVPFMVANNITKKFDDFDDFLVNPSTKEFRKEYPDVVELAKKMRGRLRSVGMHAAGVVMANEPITNYAAVESATDPDDKSKDRVEVLAMDDEAAAELGLIKFDILGVSALTDIKNTVKLIKKHEGVDIDIENMPLDDPAVYASINKKSTLGLFQLEGNAFTKILDKMPIEEFNDLVTATSLIRPGAADSSFGQRFLDARNGGDWQPYCEAMRDFTEDTYGEILYQEQLMLTVQHVGGMSVGDANKIRKIIGKKQDVHLLEPYKDRFVDGAAEHLGRGGALRMWKDFEKSANYQFNKSHAVAYSMITYMTAWLKHYYPQYFMLAVLSGEKEQTKRLNYLNEVKRLGIRIKLPHINTSGPYMEPGEDERGFYLLMGLIDVKNVGPAAADKIIKGRPWKSFEHFKSHADEDYSGINIRNIQSLDAVGAIRFEDHPLRGDEKDYYYTYLNLPSFDTSKLSPATIESLNKVEEYDKEGTFVILGLASNVTRKAGWARVDIFDETGTTGIFFPTDWDIKKGEFYIFLICNGNIVRFMGSDELDDNSPLSKYLTTEQLKPFEGERMIALSSRTTKAGNLMGTLVTTDQEKFLTGYTVYKDKYPKVHTKFKNGGIVHIAAKERDWKGTTSYVLEDIK
jgi:DNA polymerase-3 subunit alpha